jgi:hypothetical protein
MLTNLLIHLLKKPNVSKAIQEISLQALSKSQSAPKSGVPLSRRLETLPPEKLQRLFELYDTSKPVGQGFQALPPDLFLAIGKLKQKLATHEH